MIKQGAKLVASVEDILEELPQTASLPSVKEKSSAVSALDNKEAKILSCLDSGPKTWQELLKCSDLPPAKLNSYLSLLEIKGLVKNLGSGSYARKLS